jgi:predicted dehydrogenase
MSSQRKTERVGTGPEPRVVVCGTGSIGFRHLRVLRDGLQLNPVALPTRASRVSELESKDFHAVSSWETAAINKPWFAVIATDTGRHLTDATRALELGADVLIEKPISSSTEGLRELEELAERVQRRVFVACNLRFDAGLKLFRQHLPEIGRVQSVRIECQSFLPDWRPETDYRRSYSARAEEGGVLRDLIHEIDYALWLFGVPQRLFAKLKNTGALGIASDESADILWESPSGATVSIRLDYLARVARRKMHAYGELAELEWDYIEKWVSLRQPGKAAQTWPIAQERDDMMRDQLADFIGSTGTDSESFLATLDDGATAVAICDAARRSSQSGHVEVVPNWREARAEVPTRTA